MFTSLVDWCRNEFSLLHKIGTLTSCTYLVVIISEVKTVNKIGKMCLFNKCIDIVCTETLTTNTFPGWQVWKLPWWLHQMETCSVLLAHCAGNSQVTDEFPSQSPVMQSFDVFFDLCLNKRLGKQSWGWWFELSSCSLWCHCNGSKDSQNVHTWWTIIQGWF